MISRVLGLLFVAALALAGTAEAQTKGKTELLWYGQSAFKITTPGGKVIMVDPWITGGTLVPPELKDLSKIGKIDAILVTHGHGDHLGDGIELAKTHNAPLWGPAGMNQFLVTLGKLPANLAPRMNVGGT
ncbi:MAG TPA: MBL fold metallo-hydrolase, partial [Reyranella sp.]